MKNTSIIKLKFIHYSMNSNLFYHSLLQNKNIKQLIFNGCSKFKIDSLTEVLINLNLEKIYLKFKSYENFTDDDLILIFKCLKNKKLLKSISMNLDLLQKKYDKTNELMKEFKS